MKKPTLTMLVGLPGSGKTYYAKQLQEETGAMLISSDEMRVILLGDENDQQHQNELFDVIYKSIENCLLCNNDVIYDATNIAKKYRVGLLHFLKKVECYKKCIIVATPFEECMKNNDARERHVPEEVLYRMRNNFTIPAYFEGWDEIHIHYTDPSYAYYYGVPSSAYKKYLDYDQKNHHHKLSLGEHMRQTYEAVKQYGDPILNEAALLHDVGKPYCQSFIDKNGNYTSDAHYYNHHNISAYQALFYNIINDKLKVVTLVNYHMEPYFWRKQSNVEEKRKKEWPLEMYEKIIKLHAADVSAH